MARRHASCCSVDTAVTLACSGGSNVGQMANEVPSACGLKGCRQVLVLDGCPVACSKKCVDAAGVTDCEYLVVTDISAGVRLWGIVKERHRMAKEESANRSVSEDAPAREGEEQAATPACNCRALWKVALVVALVAAAGVIVTAKSRGGSPPAQAAVAGSGAQPQAGSAAPPAATPDEPGRQVDVLATVNGQPITLAELEEVLQALPAQYRAAFERSKHDLLEELITRELLLQEARRKGMVPAPGGGNPGLSADAQRQAIQDLLRQETLHTVNVTEADLRAYYEERKDEIPGGGSFETVRDRLRPIVQQEREQQAVESYVARLREDATITRDQEWVASQQELAAENPLSRALRGGKPVLADFGRGVCIPCKMMKPILDDLREAYAGRAEILIIDVDEYAALTRLSRIRAIPTQIFYAAGGREVLRHEGFMPREDIVAQLAQMGVQ